MKKTFKNALAKPKIIIPIVAIAIALVLILTWSKIGSAPAVPATLGLTTPGQAVVSGDNVSLSFGKSGKVLSVLVAAGDQVKAGDVLSKLSAPDQEGAVAQAKGALDLAQAEYASLNTQYATAKSQQDLLVVNAFRTLLSSSLEGVPSTQDPNTPIISGTYTCDTVGSYILKPYASGDSDSGYSANFSGLETGTVSVKYDNPVPLGHCGLQIKWNHVTTFSPQVTWTIDIPNKKGSDYLDHKNAYDLAVATHDKVLADLRSQIGGGDAGGVAKAQIDAAQGAYQAALGAYQNNVIVAPVSGTITFVDANLKPGQSIVAGKSVIGITQ